MTIDQSKASSPTPDYAFKDILTLKQASLSTGLSKSALYKLTMMKAIPFTKPGGKLLFFKKEDLENYLLGKLPACASQIVDEDEQYLVIRKNNL